MARRPRWRIIFYPWDRDGNSSMDTRYPSGTSMGIIFYPWVAPVPDPNLDGYEMDIFFTRE
jgi:hypothetical protein